MHATQVNTGVTFERRKRSDYVPNFDEDVTNSDRKKFFKNGRAAQNVHSAIGGLHGRSVEAKAVKAWAPKWRCRRRFAQVFKQIRFPTRHEDEVLKWDIVFETFIPKYPLIGVQIKTSLSDFQVFQKKHPDIPAVYLNVFDADSPITIRYKMMFMMHYQIPDLAMEMTKLGCTISPKMLAKIASIDPGEQFVLI